MKFICFGAGKTERPENTLTAIEHCATLNKDWTIHIDIQMTADGEVILFKDTNTERISNKALELSNSTLEELQRLDAAYNFNQNNQFAFRNKKIQIPTLNEVFEKFPNSKFILDIHAKDIAIVNKIILLVKKHNLAENIIFTSKENHIISDLRVQEESWNFAATTVRARKIIYSNMFYLDSIIPVDAHLMIIPKCDKDSLFLRERIISYCNQQGKKTWTWIFEGKQNDFNSILTQIDELENQGLDGIFTSSPLKICNALNIGNKNDSNQKNTRIAS